MFLLHGTPGSRRDPTPSHKKLHDLDVSLITFDRPGYGRSDRLESRMVADTVPDVAAIADALNVSSFAVLGMAGGGPHALACAALLPERVSRAAALGSPAPRRAKGLDWFGGMSDANVNLYMTAATDPEALGIRLIRAAVDIKADPASHIAVLTPEMPFADRQIVADANVRALLQQTVFDPLCQAVVRHPPLSNH